jgi:hypothetical protein
MKQPCYAVLLFFLVTGAFGMAQVPVVATNAEPVLFVNNEPVGPDEFVWFMRQERAAVFQFFQAGFNHDSATNFWDRQFSNTTPRILLRERTVKRIVQAKVEQILFRELGLVEEIGYAPFLKQLEEFNRERESAAQQGEVVYGPVRYTQLQYYEYWMANLRIRATEQLTQNRWDVSNGKVKTFFEENKEQFRVRERAIPTKESGSNAPVSHEGTSQIPSFDEAKSRARTQYLEWLYSQLVSDRVKHAKVTLNQAASETLIQ